MPTPYRSGLALAFTLVAGLASADPGEVVLTVTGADIGPDGQGMEFDMAMLQDLEALEFTTTTIWTDGPQTFTGVELETLVEELHIDAGAIRATAVNDYSVEIPLTDAVDGGAMIAYLRNGEPMSLREKGPLWIVYPYDSAPEFQSEVIHSRSIWQLDRIDVIE